MKILKFGGTSVGTPASIRQVIDIVRAEPAARGVVVSAMQSVTDQLLKLAANAASGGSDWREGLDQLRLRHIATANELCSPKEVHALVPLLNQLLSELAVDLTELSKIKSGERKWLDKIASYGERLCASIVAAALRSSGTAAEYCDARGLICTDSYFSSARVDYEKSDKLICEYFSAHPKLQVITGFIGSNENGETTTLGRGGSDFSAAIFGAALSATEIEIWTDVDGVMSADPRKVAAAHSIDIMCYSETLELCLLGAKVLYPPTMEPAWKKGIPLRVRNTFNPKFAGTLVGAAVPDVPQLLASVTSSPPAAILEISNAPINHHDTIKALDAERIAPIYLLQLGHDLSELAVDLRRLEDAKRILAQLNGALKIVRLYPEKELLVLSLVGDGLTAEDVVLNRAQVSLKQAKIKVYPGCRRVSPLTVAALVSISDEVAALRAIHYEFFEKIAISQQAAAAR